MHSSWVAAVAPTSKLFLRSIPDNLKISQIKFTRFARMRSFKNYNILPIQQHSYTILIFCAAGPFFQLNFALLYSYLFFGWFWFKTLPILTILMQQRGPFIGQGKPESKTKVKIHPPGIC
jgi:hypothetical protein